jgi:hypothetical protein
MSCPLCRERKGKRSCPAKDALICSACCGSKRLVEIDCPRDCVFLTGAHAGAWEGRETERERDWRRIAPYAQGLSEPQGRLLMLAVVGIHGIRHKRPGLGDRHALEAVQALRKTLETRGHGILYEHAAQDPLAQGLLQDLRELFEAKDAEGQVRAPDDRDLQPVVAALESALKAALREGGTTDFLDTAGRVARAMQRETMSQPEEKLIVAP